MSRANRSSHQKLPSPVMLARCVESGMGRNQIASHYGASFSRVTSRCKELGLAAPIDGKTWAQAEFNLHTTVVRRSGISITLPCPKIYARALEQRNG